MALEIISSVREAEKGAANIRAEAVAKAREIVAEASEKAKLSAEKTEKEAYSWDNCGSLRSCHYSCRRYLCVQVFYRKGQNKKL